MVTLNRYAFRFPAALGMSLALFAGGCGDDDGGGSSTLDGGTLDSSVPPAPDGGAPDASTAKGVYLYSVGVASPDGTYLQYVVARDRLDFNITLDDLKKGKELGGYAGVAAIDGNIIVGESETPFATKYKLEDNLVTWTQVGERLNFSNYVSDDQDGLNFYFQAIKGSDMFFYFGADRTSRVHWNVDQWKILADYRDTKLPTPPAGFSLGSNGNRTDLRDWKGPITQSFSISNDETYLPTDKTYIAVYDEATKAEKTVHEIPCPAVQQATKDEDGNLYYGTTFASSLLAQLYGQIKPTCLVKLKADGTLDPSFPQTDMKAWTGGFPGVNFRYLKDGKAMVNVLRTDKLPPITPGTTIDPAIEERVTGRFVDDKLRPADSSLWETRLVDLEAGTSRVLTGWTPNSAHTPHYMLSFVEEGRAFISVQFDPYGTPTNDVYEIDLSAATVKLVGKVVGELGTLERLR